MVGPKIAQQGRLWARLVWTLPGIMDKPKKGDCSQPLVFLAAEVGLEPTPASNVLGRALIFSLNKQHSGHRGAGQEAPM